MYMLYRTRETERADYINVLIGKSGLYAEHVTSSRFYNYRGRSLYKGGEGMGRRGREREQTLRNRG